MKRTTNVLAIILILFSFSNFAKADYLRVNYGVSSIDSGVNLKGSGATIDEDDSGFMLSAGKTLIGSMGVEAMYYDLGESSVKGSIGDTITIDNATYVFETAGTVKNETSGYGLGIFAASESTNGLGTFSGMLRFGLHHWDRSGSTTLIYESSKSFASRYYNDGVDLYLGIGLNAGLTENLALNVSYDSMGFADDGGYGNTGSLTSVGLTLNF